MRIVILAFGSRGDVQPLVALGVGLKLTGYEVVIATDPIFQTLVKRYELDFRPILGSTQPIIRNTNGYAVRKSHSPIHLLRVLHALTWDMSAYWWKNLTGSWDACRDADVLVFSASAIAGFHIAEKLNIPAFMVGVYPISWTKEFPTIFLRKRFNMNGNLNKLSHILAEQVLWQPFRVQVNTWRKKILGLPNAPFWGYSSLLNRNENVHILYEFSPHVLPSPKDWNNKIHVTGYWFLDAVPTWKPSRELTEFLRNGSAPIYIGFGSMVSSMIERSPEELTKMLLRVLERHNRRAILASGWGSIVRLHKGIEYVCFVDEIPHDWLFPQILAAIHHGGAGTTGATLRAGKPMLITPFAVDQFFWGNVVYNLGVGTYPIAATQLVENSLESAIESLCNNTFLKERAIQLGQQIGRENGVRNAIDIIENMILN